MNKIIDSNIFKQILEEDFIDPQNKEDFSLMVDYISKLELELNKTNAIINIFKRANKRLNEKLNDLI
jgi:hypothetical protein